MLAAGRFRRATGRYSRSVEELVPDYLDASFTAPRWLKWLIIDLEPFTTPDLSVGSPALKGAVKGYLLENDRVMPTEAEDLRPYVMKQTGIGQFGNSFRTFEGRPVFCCVRSWTIAPIRHLMPCLFSWAFAAYRATNDIAKRPCVQRTTCGSTFMSPSSIPGP